MRRQRSTRRLYGRVFRDGPQMFGLLSETRLEILKRQLHLRDLGIELLGGAAVPYALQARDLEAQLLELKFLRDDERFGSFEGGAARGECGLTLSDNCF